MGAPSVDQVNRILEALLTNFTDDDLTPDQESLTRSVAYALADAINVGSYDVMKRSISTSMQLDGTPAALVWDVPDIDSDGSITYNGANPTRFTIAEDGIYEIGGFFTVREPSIVDLQATVRIYVNGVAEGAYRGGSIISNSGNSWDYWVIELSNTPMKLAAGDYIEFYGQINTGSGYSSGDLLGEVATLQSSGRTVAWVKKVRSEAAAAVS